MAQIIDAIDFVAHPDKYPAAPVCVLFGDEQFLQRQAMDCLRAQVAGDEDGEFSVAALDGETSQLRDVLDELSTIPLFGGGRRLVVVEAADDFVSRERAALEDYVARPKKSAVLVLVVRSWPSNTRLAKAVAVSGLPIECKCPPPARLTKWLIGWAQRRHQIRLEPDAATALVEQVEPELGLLDQELAKLAALAGKDGTISAATVEEHVGGWRTKTAWELLDAALNGETAAALEQLDHLLLGGEAPIALLGQIGASLRRLGAAVRLLEQAEITGLRVSLRQALERAGIKPFVLSKSESQLRRLGRARGAAIYRRLLAADLALKGSSSSPARSRLLLEEFIIWLSAAQPAAAR